MKSSADTPSDTVRGAVVLPATPSVRERRAEWSVAVLYLFFFLLWLAGLCTGLFYDGGAVLFGFPLWFSLGGIVAYGVVCVALALTVRRYFR